MRQKGNVSFIPLLVIIFGLIVGVYFFEQSTGFLSHAWDIIGPSKSATIKIPFTSPEPSLIATGSATPATGSASPKATASASASVKPSASASAVIKPLASPIGPIPIPNSK